MQKFIEKYSKDKLLIFLFVFVLLLFGLGNVFVEDREISSYERRKLTSLEDLKKDILGTWDEYLSDQIPFRDEMISFYTIYKRYVLNDLGMNDVYIDDGYIFERDQLEDLKGLNEFLKKIKKLKNKYMNNSRIFYTIVPNKSYFLKKDYPKMDYDLIREIIRRDFKGIPVRIDDLIALDDYYMTDIHLRQVGYFDYVSRFVSTARLDGTRTRYTKKVYEPFYGASYSKGPLSMKPDKIEYYTNYEIENTKVVHFEYGEREVYDEEKLAGVDAYDVFLSGPSALIEIETGNVDKGELVVIRDSYASSLVPLLIPYYSKITLVDLRYMKASLLEGKVNFDGADVLFIYGASSVEQSHLLKVDF